MFYNDAFILNFVSVFVSSGRVRTGRASLGVDNVTEAVMAVGVEECRQACQVGVNIRGVVIRVAGQVGEIKLNITGVPTAESISYGAS